MRTSLFIRKAHQWLAWIIGIQIILWFLSGFVMSWFDIEKVRGEHILKANDATAAIDVTSALAAYSAISDSTVLGIQTVMLKGEPHLLVQGPSSKHLFDPTTQQIVSPLSSALASEIVQHRLVNPTPIAEVSLMEALPGEVRGRKAPLWQVALDDEENTRIYLSPQTGQVVATRTDTWRLFDFFWMLHIMDYKDRSDFNHPLLITAVLLALFVAFSGVFLLIQSLQRKRRKKA